MVQNLSLWLRSTDSHNTNRCVVVVHVIVFFVIAGDARFSRTHSSAHLARSFLYLLQNLPRAWQMWR